MTNGSPRRLGSVFAPAKINLALHVVGRRADGYHRLDSLVVFADVGDTLTAERPLPGAPLLTIDGPFAADLPLGDDNLVLCAARLLAERFGMSPPALRLTKRLPVASGIGGGSADGAATLRLLAALAGLDAAPLADLALRLGADGPMCLESRPLRAGGIGEVVAPLAGLPQLGLVLAHPGIAVPTAAVFRRLACPDNPPLPDPLPVWRDAAELARFLHTATRNDLEAPALAEAAVIAEISAALRASEGCLFARMSGSGATVFGLYADIEAAHRASAALAGDHPNWWVRAAGLAEADSSRPRLVLESLVADDNRRTS